MGSEAQARAEFDAAFPELVLSAERAIGRFYRYDDSQVEDALAETMARTYADWARIRRHRNTVASVAAHAKDVCLEQVQHAAASEPDRVGVHMNIELSAPTTVSASMARSLARLSRRQRDVAVLHYLMGCDEATTAAALRTSVGNVRAAAQKARSRSLFVMDAAIA